MTLGIYCNRQTVIAGRDDTLVEAARRMRKHNVGALVVVDETNGGRKPVGMLTDRDIVVRVVAEDLEDAERLRVGDIMSLDIVTGHEGDDLEATLGIMQVRGVRRLPVVDDHGNLVGIIALDDLLELTAERLDAFVKLMGREQQIANALHR